MNEYCPVVILDYRVVVYNLYYQYTILKNSKFSKKFLDNWLKTSWAIVVNRGPTALPYMENHRVIVVSDSSPYWRSKYLESRGFPEYKGGRPDKTTEWYEVNSAGIAYLSGFKSPIDFIEVPGYEADDIAGALVRLNPGRLIFLHTIDSDWMGLVDDGELKKGISLEELSQRSGKIDPTTIWTSLREWSPRIRDEEGVRAHCLRRMGIEIDKPPELWLEKVQQGDKSDNLIPGSPIEVIDLLNPPEEFDLLNHPIRSFLEETINNPYPNTSKEHIKKSVELFKKIGQFPPVFGLDQFPIAF